ncbi:MAG: hypothetical protein AAB214_03420 [Fibrobacterota bacterium]
MNKAVLLAILALSACRAPKSDAEASKDSAAVANAAILDTTFVMHKTTTDSGIVYRGRIILSDSTKSDRTIELKEHLMPASTGAVGSRTSAEHGVRLSIDSVRVHLQHSDPIAGGEGATPLVLGPGSFSANVTIANHTTKTVLLFPPSYGQYLSIFKTEVKFGDSTFELILRTDIDYAPYDAEKILPGGKKSFRMSFSMRDMYDKDGQGKTDMVDIAKYGRLLRTMKSIAIRYDSKFDKYMTVWDGEKESVERNPLFGKYTVLDLRDTFQVFRN